MTLELLVEVDTDIESVIGLKSVVVAVFEVSYGAGIVVGRMGLVLIVVRVEGSAIARSIYPCGRKVDAVAQLWYSVLTK